MEKIKVLIKDPGLPARFLTIPNDLKTLQGIVDGYIEIVTVDDICVVCNEEGKIRGMQPNITFGGHDFVGTIVMTGPEGDELTSFPYGLGGES